MEITEIKNIPHSPGTSWDVTEVFNPLSESFTWSMDGKPYTIPANNSKGFPEFIARHLAKHLARKIVYGNAYEEIKEKSKGQITPDNAKAIPNTRVEKMEAWLLQPSGSSPENNKGVKISEIKEEPQEGVVSGVEESTEKKLKDKIVRMKRQKRALKVKLSKQVEKKEEEKETN